jgi:hypothetical protein
VGTRQGLLYAIGGRDGPHDHATVEVLDVVANVWTQSAPLRRPRSAVAAVDCGGHIFAIGGWRQAEAAHGGLCDVEALAPAAARPGGEWTAAAPMRSGRAFPGAAALGGRIYVLGGRTATAEAYDPGADAWAPVASLSQPRWGPAVGADVAGGRVFAAGGNLWEGASLDSAECFDPREGRWRPLPPLPFEFWGAAAVWSLPPPLHTLSTLVVCVREGGGGKETPDGSIHAVRCPHTLYHRLSIARTHLPSSVATDKARRRGPARVYAARPRSFRDRRGRDEAEARDVPGT